MYLGESVCSHGGPAGGPRSRYGRLQIYSKGLKFGMYTDIGIKTCGGYPGLGNGHTQRDIETFMEWNIDSLKVDGCYADVDSMSVLYSSLGEYLNSTGRPVLYSCSWPAYTADNCENPQDMKTLKNICNLWRNYDDISDSVCLSPSL